MSAKLSIVKFGAEWCMPCKVMDKYFDKVVNSFNGEVEYEKVDTAEEPQKAVDAKINAIPVLVFNKDGKEIHRVVGLLSETKLQEKIQELLGTPSTPGV